MAYFRTLNKLQELLGLFAREDRWLIVINADPDAMASAMALKRIMRYRVKDVEIARVNEVTRPDNLAMIRYTRLHMRHYTPARLQQYNKFAVVDSQPTHHPLFADIPFSIVIDHHPLPEKRYDIPYVDIRPEYGATATMMTEYLYNLRIRPAKLLATALLFGIKTDTASFERNFVDVDFRAYQYLAKYADQTLLARIVRSEFHRSWLEFFARACTNMYTAGSGQYVCVGDISNTDILVTIADFFMRVYEIHWAAVCGVCDNMVVVVFRSDGISRDVGALASGAFGALGSAGGHKSMARAEVPLEALNGQDVELFVWKRLTDSMSRKRKKDPAKK